LLAGVVAQYSAGACGFAVQDIGDLLAQARAKRAGCPTHGRQWNLDALAGELLKNLSQVDIVAIPYKGRRPAMNDLLGGQIRCRSTTD